VSLDVLEKPDLESLIDDWPFPVLLIDTSDLRLNWANHAAQEWLGQSLKRLSQKPFSDFLKIEADIRTLVDRSIAGGAPVTRHDCLMTRNGQRAKMCDLTVFPTKSGACIAIQTESQRPQQSKIGGHVVSGLGRMIAHELKNPLAGIKGAAQLLRDDVETDESISLIDLIIQEIDRIRRLADRMETLGDQDPDNVDSVNIHELLRRARRIIQSANSDLIFTERYDPSLPHAKGDADTLMQALLNLIKNASEAVAGIDGGELRLETAFRSGVRRRTEGTGEDLVHLPIEIRIIDNGPGIPETMRDQLFQPFASTKPGGQGLGLSMVSKIAAAHGGVVEVQSRPGHTVFSLLLPVPDGGRS